jgi:hypothetical protein
MVDEKLLATQELNKLVRGTHRLLLSLVRGLIPIDLNMLSL